MANLPWSSDEVRKAKELLGKFDRIIDALPTLSHALHRHVTANSLKAAFAYRRDEGVMTPSSYLKRPSFPTPKFKASLVEEDEEELELEPEDDPDPLEQHIKAREARSAKSREQELLERLREARERQTVLDALDKPFKPLRIKSREKTSGLREGTAVILASDWHVEEVVDPQKVAGRNSYNLEIAKHRAQRFFEGIVSLNSFARNKFSIRDVILWLGGDLMTGFIHEELVETNDLGPIETVLELRSMLVGGIDFLLLDPQIESLKIPCSFGNHGRTTHKRRSKTGAENSYEWLLYNILKLHYQNEPRVEFAVDKSAHQYVEAYDFRLHFHHGDTVRSMGGVGGISIPLNKRIPKWDNVLHSDYHHVGHFHTFIDLGRTVVNGSLIGYSEYAFDCGFDYEVPQQAYYVLDSKRGKCLPTPIWVDDDASIHNQLRKAV